MSKDNIRLAYYMEFVVDRNTEDPLDDFRCLCRIAASVGDGTHSYQYFSCVKLYIDE